MRFKGDFKYKEAVYFSLISLNTEVQKLNLPK